MGAILVVGKGFIMDAPTITPQPDSETGLVPCGCGMPAICIVETTIMYGEKKRVKYYKRRMLKGMIESRVEPKEGNKVTGSSLDELMRKTDAEDFDTEQEHLWALGNTKDETGFTWEDIAGILNNKWRIDESEHYTESAYRKRYTMAKELFDIVIRPEFEELIAASSAAESETRASDVAQEYVNRLEEERQRLYEEKVRMWDARREYNKAMRTNARVLDTLEMLEREIAELALKERPAFDYTRPVFEGVVGVGPTELLACVSDVHYGMEFNNFSGKYNSEIAEERMNEYADKIISVGYTYKANGVNVVLLGDLISGNIHHSISVENKENVIQQIVGVSDMISRFVEKLSGVFENVNVYAVPGNHSRLQPKDIAIKDERLDDLVLWYLQARLGAIDNVKVLSLKDREDNTFTAVTILDKEYIAVHGDYDPFTDAGMARLVMWLGRMPYGVVYGHRHEFASATPHGVRAIRSGSLCGSGDSFTLRHRLKGEASQTLCVCTEKGVEAIVPVTFNV